jgi:hypothetical protein
MSTIIHYFSPPFNTRFSRCSFVSAVSERVRFDHSGLCIYIGDMGVYTKSVQRQLFDIHHALTIDRPTLRTPLLNREMLSYATEVRLLVLSLPPSIVRLGFRAISIVDSRRPENLPAIPR